MSDDLQGRSEPRMHGDRADRAARRLGRQASARTFQHVGGLPSHHRLPGPSQPHRDTFTLFLSSSCQNLVSYLRQWRTATRWVESRCWKGTSLRRRALKTELSYYILELSKTPQKTEEGCTGGGGLFIHEE